MNIKLLKILIVLVLVGLVGFMTFNIYGKIKQKTLTEDNRKTLPAFTFKTLTGEAIKGGQLKGKPLVLVYFNPECDHCQYQIREFVTNADKFSEVELLLISPESKEKVADFVKVYNVGQLKEARVLLDPDYDFHRYFGVSGFPSVLIYDADQQLSKIFQGEVKISAILKYLG